MVQATLTSLACAMTPACAWWCLPDLHAGFQFGTRVLLYMQVSADGEEVLYKACMNAGITMLSIGHRPALRKHHQVIVHFDGTQQGKGWRLEEVKNSHAYEEPTVEVGEALDSHEHE